MKRIDFDRNANGKLSCNYFVDLRQWNPAKYVVGESYEAYVNGTLEGEVKLIEGREFALDKLPPMTAMLATGYGVNEAKAVLRKMNPKYNGTFGAYLFFWVLRDQLPPRQNTKAGTPGNAEERPGTHGEDANQPTPHYWGGGLASCRLIKYRLEQKGELTPRRFAHEAALTLYQDRLAQDHKPEERRATAYLIWVDAADVVPEWATEEAFGEISQGLKEARAAFLGPLPAG